jgi:hypothetical protein
MKLTKSMQRLIENQIRSAPLAEGEIRRIAGMGGLFVTKSALHDDTTKDDVIHHGKMAYWFQYALDIEGTVYHFYGGLPSTNQAS